MCWELSSRADRRVNHSVWSANVTAVDHPSVSRLWALPVLGQRSMPLRTTMGGMILNRPSGSQKIGRLELSKAIIARDPGRVMDLKTLARSVPHMLIRPTRLMGVVEEHALWFRSTGTLNVWPATARTQFDWMPLTISLVDGLPIDVSGLALAAQTEYFE